MRNPFRPPPSPEHLRELRVHELVRDYPELLALLGVRGLDLGETGTEDVTPLDLALEGEGVSLEEFLSWREADGA